MKILRALFALLLLLSPGVLMAEEGPVRETTVYIPFEEFWKTFEREDRGVFLPYKEFRELWDAARAAAKTQTPFAPEGVAFAEITGTAEVVEQVVRADARLVLDAMSPGWHEVDLGLKGVTLSRAVMVTDTGERPARIRGSSAAGYTLLLHQEGDAPERHTLHLNFTAALSTESEGQGTRGFSFSLPPAPISRWELLIPEPGVELSLEPRLATTAVPEADPDTETRVLVFLGATPALSVRWIPRVEGARDMDALVQSFLLHRVQLANDFNRTHVEARLTISRVPIEAVSFRIPAGERVVEVSSPGLRAWSVAEEECAQRLDVTFLRPVRDRHTVHIRTERYQPPARRQVPILEVVGGVLPTGQVRVELAEDLRADVRELSGLTRMNIPQPAGRNAPAGPDTAAFHYEYTSLPASLELEVEPVLPQITANNLIVAQLDPEMMELHVQSTLDVRRAGVFQVTLDVPEGFELFELRVSPAAHRLDSHRLGEPGNGRRTLFVEFASRVSGQVTLNFILRQEQRREALLSHEGGEEVFEIPVVRASGSQVSTDEGQVVVTGPAYLTFRAVETAAMRPLPVIPPVTTSQVRQFAYSYASEAPLLRVGAVRKAPHVTVEQLMSVRVEVGVAHFESTLHTHVRYSGVRGLRVDVPANLTELIQIRPADVRRRVMADAEGVEEGQVAWMLERPAELLGNFALVFSWEIPMEGLVAGEERPLPVPRLIPRGVDRASGQVVLRKADTLDISVAGEPAGLNPIDPRHDLIQRARFPDAALAFEFQNDWSITAAVTRYEPAALKSTGIERGLVRQVLTRGGQTTVQAIYRMRSTRQRLELQLPPGAEFDSRPLRVNGRPVTLERGAADHVYIPLTGQNADEAFLLEIRYNLPEGGGRLRVPRFVESPAMQQVYLSVHVPENQVYLGHRGQWNPEFIWRVGKGFRLTPSARRGNAELLAWVSEGVSVDRGSLDILPVDGQHLLFSALHPDTEGVTLRVSTFPLRGFYGFVIGAGVLLGLALVRCRIATRLLAVAGAAVFLVLAAVFTPSLSRAVINDATAAGAALILILWFAWDLVVRLPQWRSAHPHAPPAPARPARGAAAYARRTRHPAAPAVKPPAPAPDPTSTPSGTPDAGEVNDEV